MKDIRQDENGLFICEECGQKFITKQKMTYHIKKHNITYKEYFDKWLKEETDGVCAVCGNETDFIVFTLGYKKGCSYEHSNKARNISYEKTCLEKYGVSHTSKVDYLVEAVCKSNLEKYGNRCTLNTPENRKKREETWIKNYGVDSPFKNKEFKNKCNIIIQNIYGVDNIAKLDLSKDKIKKTNNDRYGTDWYTQSDNFKEKTKDTNLKRYGCENVLQNDVIFNKQQKTSLKIKKYKDTDIYYQGSYEYDFLEKYYDKIPDLKRGLTFKYNYKNKIKGYHSDFYIPSLNLIIECKNIYLYNRDKDIINAKKQSVLDNGYNYIMILDKDYTEFNNYLL